MSKIIVTGGAGFIGSHLVDKLTEEGHEVIIIDDLSAGKIENINSKATLLQGDISETQGLMYGISRNTYGQFHKICKGTKYVFHLAAIPRVPYSLEHPSKTHRVNVTGTFNVLIMAKELGVEKVIFASSSSVYGDQELPLREEMIPKPKSLYALHKLIGEQYMRAFDEIYTLPTLSLRFFNVYGKRADPNSEYSLVIAKFLKLRKERKPLPIYGDGEQTRDFTYVSDVVDACIKAMKADAHNQVINICNNKNVSVNEIAKLIGGRKSYELPRKGDVLHTLGDNERAKILLTWQPRVTVKEGLRRMKNAKEISNSTNKS